MAYVLDIKFTGMCGFVPLRKEGIVHVLLPDTSLVDAHAPPHEGSGHDQHGTHETGPMETHVSRLLFDTTALHEGATESEDRWPVVVSLQKRALEFAGGAMLNPDISSEFAPLHFLAAGLLGAEGDRALVTRVILRAGCQYDAHPGATWLDHEDTVRPMSHQLTWRIEGLTAPLRLTLKSIASEVDRVLPPLYPDAGGKLSLHVLHVPRSELPPEPREVRRPRTGTPAHHFSALNLLVTQPVVLPLFIREPLKDPSRGMSPYTCLGARIEPQPTVA